MKKKKYDILVKIKKINKNKLVYNLNNLNNEKEKLKDHSSVIDYMKRWDLDKQPKGWRKFGRGKDFEYVTSDEYKKRQAAKKAEKGKACAESKKTP